MTDQRLGPLQLKWVEALESGEYPQGGVVRAFVVSSTETNEVVCHSQMPHEWRQHDYWDLW